MRTIWLCRAVATLPLLLYGHVMAQESLFLDAVEVKVASVEVVVEDRDGKNISGLSSADFEILEDGVRQPIEYFSSQENGKLVVSDGEGTVAPTDRLHLAIFVDDLHLAPQNRKELFARLKSYLQSELQPSDLVLIARLTDRLVIEQPFTDKVAELEATVDRLAASAGGGLQAEATYQRIVRALMSTATPTKGEVEAMKSNSMADLKVSPIEMSRYQAEGQAREIVAFSEERRIRVLGTIKALDTAVGSLAGLPGRKALIYLTDGLPVRAGLGLTDMWRDKYEQWALQNGERGLLDELSRVQGLSIEAESELKKLAEEASTARVAFYVQAPGSSLSRGGGNSAANSGFALASSTTEAFENQVPLLELAEKTGGKARTSNSDIASLLNDVRDDFGTFYSLGYKPKTEAKDGMRKIAVKVRGRPDAKIRYTRSLGDADPVEQLRELTISALYHGLTENPLGIELEAKPAEDLGGNKYRVEMLVKVPFEKLLLLPQEANHVGRLTLFVVVQDHQSHNLSSMNRVEVPLKIPNEQILSVMSQKAAYPLNLEMKGGSQRLAIGMRDHLGRVSSTVEVDLDVPDTLASAIPAPAAPPSDGDAAPTGGAR